MVLFLFILVSTLLGGAAPFHLKGQRSILGIFEFYMEGLQLPVIGLIWILMGSKYLFLPYFRNLSLVVFSFWVKFLECVFIKV